MKEISELGPLKQLLADYYSQRSSTYDSSDYHQRLTQRLIDHARIQPGFEILDIATGTGLLAIAAAKLAGPDGRVVGVDISDGMMNQARQKIAAEGLRNIELRKAEAESLELPGERFDRVLCSSALTFMTDVPAIMRRWRGFLKPGGRVVFDSPSKTAFITGVVLKEIAASRGVELRYGVECATEENCRAAIQDAGFTDVDVFAEQFGGFISAESAVATWEATLKHPLSRPLLRLSPEQLDRIKTEFATRLNSLETDKGIWNDGTVLIVSGMRLI